MIAQEAARKILQHMGGESNQMNRIYPIPVFRSEVAKAIDFNGRLTDDDTQILLTYLGREKSAVTYDNQVSHAILSFLPFGYNSSRLSSLRTRATPLLHSQTRIGLYHL